MIRRPSSLAALTAPGLLCALAAFAAAPACGGGGARARAPAAGDLATDPEGPHAAAVAAVVQPYLDAELVSGLVIGLIDAGRREIYGFGKGPGGAAPDGGALFELGTATRVYTGLLLADAVQRREVDLDAEVASYLPPGVTVPAAGGATITLRHLALHGSGLPPLPPGLGAAADPLGGYDEDRLYRDLIRTELVAAPGTTVAPSTYGTGLLGFALGRRLGVGYARALAARVLLPLELHDTALGAPPGAAARRMAGTDDDLAAAPSWSWGALAAAGGVISSARDQLRLLEAELDAAAGGKALPLCNPMRLTQEPQLERGEAADNIGLGWMLDGAGRLWQAGGSAGFRAFLAFDPRSRRGVVVLAATASPVVDRLGRALLALVGGEAPAAWTPPPPARLAAYAGTYDFGGNRLALVASGKRLYLQAPGEPRVRLLPVSDHEFWIEALGAVAIFQDEGGKVARVVFGVGARQLVAPRVE